jgi:hypothetical protein
MIATTAALAIATMTLTTMIATTAALAIATMMMMTTLTTTLTTTTMTLTTTIDAVGENGQQPEQPSNAGAVQKVTVG